MDLQAAHRRLAALEANEALCDEDNLRGRISAINALGEIADYAAWRPAHEGWQTLGPPAEALRLRLEAVNTRYFHTLRQRLCAGRYSCAEVRQLAEAYTDYTPTPDGDVLSGPDRLDTLLDGLLGLTAPPARTKARLPDTSPYEPAPARVVLQILDRASLSSGDIFYDIGSGLGRVVILFNLLTGQSATGIENNPDLCALARQSTQPLGLTRVSFTQADAREVDYSEGTVFFMFTPFKALIWRAVMDKLRHVSQQHPLKLFTLGPCTLGAC